MLQPPLLSPAATVSVTNTWFREQHGHGEQHRPEKRTVTCIRVTRHHTELHELQGIYINDVFTCPRFMIPVKVE